MAVDKLIVQISLGKYAAATCNRKDRETCVQLCVKCANFS